MVSDKPTFRFLEEAEADFHEGLRYYVKHDRVVAERFDRLIKRTTARIVESPLRWPIKNGSRRYVLPRFPYTIAYRVSRIASTARSFPLSRSPITAEIPNPGNIVGSRASVPGRSTLSFPLTWASKGCIL